MPANLENSAVATGLEKVSFHSNPKEKKGNSKERSNYCKIALISHASNSVSRFSRWVVSDSLRPQELQHTRPPCPSPTPGIHSDSRPLSQWCHTTIKPSHPLSSPSPPAPNPSQHQSFFQWVNSSHEVAKVLELMMLSSWICCED